MSQINFLAVLVAAIANFIIGFLLHGPVAGKLWMRLANIHPTGNEKLGDMVPQMIKNFLVNVIFAAALAMVYLLASTSSAAGGAGLVTGLLVAFVVWFGFLFTTTAIEVIWMGRSWKLWVFELSASLLSTVAMVGIIILWP